MLKPFFSLLITLFSFHALADEGGLGIGAASVPHYMGAAEHYQLTLPFPFLFEEKSIFYDEKKIFILDVDGNFNLPISGDSLSATEPINHTDSKQIIGSMKNYARRGMGFLPAAIYIGAKTGIQIGPLTLEGSATPGVLIGHNWGSGGLLTKARVKLHLFTDNSPKSARCLCLVTEAIYSNKTYNQLYYGVEAKHAITGRAEYDARKSGYLGTKFEINYLHRISSVVLMGFMSLTKMNGSVVENSPLIIRKENMSAGIGLGYIF